MRYIVTGGAGFIGHNVVQQLEALGHECIILDSVTDYGFVNKTELAYLLQERKHRIRANIHYLDLRNHKQVEDFFRSFSVGCAGVIHLASFPRQKVFSKNPIWGADVMGTGLINLLEMTKNYRIPKFVYVSSSMVYGDFNDGVRETADCMPIGQYGIMKYMGEKLVEDYNRRGCFDYTIVRPSAVYGEYDVEDRVVSKFLLAAMRGETLTVHGATESLDFTHVSDAASGIVLAATRTEANGNTYNITRSASKTITLLDAAALCIKVAGKGKIDIQDKNIEYPSRGRLNIDAAKADLGYNPIVNFKQGVKMYYDWFKASPYWKTKI
jgi:nucleoside-diphosphate-sugar epimerase